MKAILPEGDLLTLLLDTSLFVLRVLVRTSRNRCFLYGLHSFRLLWAKEGLTNNSIHFHQGLSISRDDAQQMELVLDSYVEHKRGCES